MAKKKKVAVEEQKKSASKITTTDSLNYQGNVTISIVSGKRILETRQYHNKGCFKLFEFICTALGGTFESKSRPCQIALFTCGDLATDTVANPDFSNNAAITPYILQDTSAIIDRTESENDKCAVIYHFRIPYSFISTLAGSTSTKIYKAAIYGLSATTTTYDKMCAYYLFTNSDMTDWNPVSLDNLTNGNYSIIIEWTMTISNQTNA